MASRLADETLAHILEQVLTVEDEDFASCARASPFGQRQGSSSNLLLVSKRWLRVCTPALYSCIILRSSAQAQSLVRALKKTGFGSYIRQLRLEGWFGASIPKIFAAAANLKDICFPMNADTKDNVQGFCSSIGSTSARRIIVWNHGNRWSKAYDLVHSAVSEWLKTITTSIEIVLHSDALYDEGLMDIICALPGLTMLTLHNVHYGHSAYEQTLRTALLGPKMRAVRIQFSKPLFTHEPESTILKTLDALFASSELLFREEKLALRFSSTPRSEGWLSLAQHRARIGCSDAENGNDPSSLCRKMPMSDQPLPLQLDIWTHILTHSVSLPNQRLHKRYMSNDASSVRLQLAMTVSRLFHKAATNAAARHLTLGDDVQIRSFSSSPVRHTQSGNVLSVCTTTLREHFMVPQGWTPEIGDAFVSLCASFSNLAYLQLQKYPYSRLGAMADAVGPTLLKLVITVEPQSQHMYSASRDSRTGVARPIPPATPQTLRFCLLRELHIDSTWERPMSTSCMTGCQTYLWDLPMLQELVFSNRRHVVLEDFTRSSLPSLSRFTVDPTRLEPPGIALLDEFLEVHGTKLTEVSTAHYQAESILELCPNLKVLRLDRTNDPPHPLESPHPPTALRLLSLPIPFESVFSSRRHSMVSRLRRWEPFIEALITRKVSHFPALERLSMGFDYTWPVDAAEINNSLGVIIAEKLMASGYVVVDSVGASWRPRLRIGRGVTSTSTSGKAKSVRKPRKSGP